MAHPISHPRSVIKHSSMIRSLADFVRRGLTGSTHVRIGHYGREDEPKPVIEIKAGLITTLMSMR